MEILESWVRRKLPDQSVIEGAGFLEAKIRDVKSGKFKMRAKQSEKILARSPQTQLLLYDHDPVVVLDFQPESLPWSWFPYPHYHDSKSVISYGPLLPFGLAIAIGQFNESLYRFCHSFSHQLTRRYFNLLDLDFSSSAVDAVKGLPGKFDSPNVVMIVRIASNEENLPEDVRPNSELYRAIQ